MQCNLSLSSIATSNFTLPINPFIKDQWNFPYSLKHLSRDGPLYILRGKRLYFPKNVVLLSLKIDFVLANYADPDEMSPSYGIYLSGLSLFVKWFLVEQNGPGIFFGHAKFSNIFFVYLICLIFFCNQ